MIRKRGTPVAVLVEAEQYQRLQEIEDRVRRMELAQAVKGKRFSLEQALRKLEITS